VRRQRLANPLRPSGRLTEDETNSIATPLTLNSDAESGPSRPVVVVPVVRQVVAVTYHLPPRSNARLARRLLYFILGYCVHAAAIT
jgi:hypothetical protein